eukprot:692068-Pyramimonas_sp.AAC.1
MIEREASSCNGKILGKEMSGKKPLGVILWMSSSELFRLNTELARKKEFTGGSPKRKSYFLSVESTS